MSMQRRLVLGAVALLVLLGASLAWSDDTPGAGKPAAVAFTGKAVHVKAKGLDGLLLEEAQLKVLGDRLFLTGKDVEDGFRVWVPMSDIVKIEEFADVGQLKKQYTFRVLPDRKEILPERKEKTPVRPPERGRRPFGAINELKGFLLPAGPQGAIGTINTIVLTRSMLR
jgi:hypothetical protein